MQDATQRLLRREHDGVAIRGRLENCFRSDDAARTRTDFDQYRLAEFFLKDGRELPRERVRPRTGRERER